MAAHNEAIKMKIKGARPVCPGRLFPESIMNNDFLINNVFATCRNVFFCPRCGLAQETSCNIGSPTFFDRLCADCIKQVSINLEACCPYTRGSVKPL